MKRQALLTGVVVLSAVLLSASVPADSQPSVEPLDQMLETALNSPHSFMFTEKMTSKVDPHAELVITSARGVHGTPEKLFIRSRTMRVFRADAALDDFTRQGGWYWRCGDAEGKSQFESLSESWIVPSDGAGPLIMVVREDDGTVHWYALTIDFRC